MRLLIACAIVVICGYGLCDYRALYANCERIFGRDAWRLRRMLSVLAIRLRGVVSGHKKSPNVVSVKAW